MRGNPCPRCDEWWTARAEVSPLRAMALTQEEEPESPPGTGDHRESDVYEKCSCTSLLTEEYLTSIQHLND